MLGKGGKISLDELRSAMRSLGESREDLLAIGRVEVAEEVAKLLKTGRYAEALVLAEQIILQKGAKSMTEV